MLQAHERTEILESFYIFELHSISIVDIAGENARSSSLFSAAVSWLVKSSACHSREFLVHVWQVSLFSNPTNFDALSSTLFQFLDLQNLASCTLQPLAVSKRRLQPEHTQLSSSETADDLLHAVDTRSATTELSSLLTVTSLASAELFNLKFSPASVSKQPAFFFLPTSTSLPMSSRDWFSASMRVPKRPLWFPVRTSTFF